MSFLRHNFLVNDIHCSSVISVVFIIPLTVTQASEQCAHICQIHLPDSLHKLHYFLILVQEKVMGRIYSAFFPPCFSLYHEGSKKYSICEINYLFMCIISTSTDSNYNTFVKAIHSVALLTKFLISSYLKKGCQNHSDFQKFCVVQVGQSVKWLATGWMT
jgi:hypothetical protein